MKRFCRFKKILVVLLCLLSLYGLTRLYYAVTGGFSIGNIRSDLQYDPEWNVRPLEPEESQALDLSLDQEYTYLGKGCQAYVFASADGQYVLKFFKYQRFCPQAWINTLTFIPAIRSYQDFKAKEKKNKLDNVFRSWKIAYENLEKETGVLFVHLNKSSNLNKQVTIRDKMGFKHKLDLDQMEFLVQQKATMLSPTLTKLMDEKRFSQAKSLVDHLLTMLLSEYARGYADNDHALMQNTGVSKGMPVHIDVGQFIYNDSVKDPAIYNQELFDKTYKFHLWLKKVHPELANHLQNRLVAIMGEEYFLKGPYVHKSDVAKIPHVAAQVNEQ